jgi:hypothetical protein
MRIFLIGNGPSLNQTPLELLKDEDTMAMNAISLIYDQTSWRPTYYYCMDVNENDTRRWKSIEDNLGCKKLFLWEDFQSRFSGDNIEWLKRCKYHHFYQRTHSKTLKEWHLPVICTANGSMNPMAQLAVTMGYNEIYLVGVDMFAKKYDHFHPAYPIYTKFEERNAIELHTHSIIKKSCPVPIYNATVGGQLEIYPRVDLERLLRETHRVSI